MGGSTSFLCNRRFQRVNEKERNLLLIPIALASVEGDSPSGSVVEEDWVIVNDRSLASRSAIAARDPCSPELFANGTSLSQGCKMIYHLPAHLEQRFVVRKAKRQYEDNCSADSLIADHVAILRHHLAYHDVAVEADSIIVKPRTMALKVVSVPLKQQSTLNLCNRRLKFLTGDIQFLGRVQTLDLSFNQLCTLPAAIGSLFRLRTLDLSSNQLKHLCPEIGQLANLKHLILKDNQLRQLPDQIGGLKSLVTLDLSRNQLERLSKAVGSLVLLSKLDVSQNKLSYLPIELSFLRQLSSIYVNGNPLYNGLMVKAANAMHVQRKKAQSFKDLALQCLSISNNIDNLPLPVSLRLSIAKARVCSHCSSLFLGRPVYRFRMIRNAQRNLPFVYEMCSAHWNAEEERLQSLFTSTPNQIAQSSHNFRKQSNVLFQLMNASKRFFSKQWSKIKMRLPDTAKIEDMYKSVRDPQLVDRIRTLEGDRIPAHVELEILVRRDFIDLVKKNLVRN